MVNSTTASVLSDCKEISFKYNLWFVLETMYNCNGFVWRSRFNSGIHCIVPNFLVVGVSSSAYLCVSECLKNFLNEGKKYWDLSDYEYYLSRELGDG